MWHAVALALYTGQRQGDVLAMTRSKVKNGLIEVRQEKTGRSLVIPAHQKLLAVIETLRGDAVQLLTNTRGKPWTKCGFKASDRLRSGVEGRCAALDGPTSRAQAD
jgi:integrase